MAASTDPAWPALRHTIAADVLEHGWNDRLQSFTAAYDGTDLDAASLYVGLSGLLDPADSGSRPRSPPSKPSCVPAAPSTATGAMTALPGDEGGFHLCTAWLIEAYLLTGRRDDAEELFGQFVATAGPTGLLPEEYDPVAERSLGNHPQAYSHLGLIRCAQLLARPGSAGTPEPPAAGAAAGGLASGSAATAPAGLSAEVPQHEPPERQAGTARR